MRTILNLILVCILLTCQQHIAAQSYNLGTQKQSFAYETLYAKRPQKSQVENSQVVKSNNEMVNTQPAQPLASPEDIQKCEQAHKQIVKLHDDIVTFFNRSGCEHCLGVVSFVVADERI